MVFFGGMMGCSKQIQEVEWVNVRGLRSQSGCQTSMLRVGRSVHWQLKRHHGSTGYFWFAVNQNEVFKTQDSLQ